MKKKRKKEKIPITIPNPPAVTRRTFQTGNRPINSNQDLFSSKEEIANEATAGRFPLNRRLLYDGTFVYPDFSEGDRVVTFETMAPLFYQQWFLPRREQRKNRVACRKGEEKSFFFCTCVEVNSPALIGLFESRRTDEVDLWLGCAFFFFFRWFWQLIFFPCSLSLSNKECELWSKQYDGKYQIWLEFCIRPNYWHL